MVLSAFIGQLVMVSLASDLNTTESNLNNNGYLKCFDGVSFRFPNKISILMPQEFVENKF